MSRSTTTPPTAARRARPQGGPPLFPQPGAAADPAAARVLANLGFATGAAGFVVPLALLLAGVAVPSLIVGLLPRSLAWAGLVIAAIGALSTLALLTPALDTVTAGLFALEHAYYPILLPLALSYGLAAGWVRHRTQSTVTTIAMHITVDFALFAAAVALS